MSALESPRAGLRHENECQGRLTRFIGCGTREPGSESGDGRTSGANARARDVNQGAGSTSSSSRPPERRCCEMVKQTNHPYLLLFGFSRDALNVLEDQTARRAERAPS
jgi:hypothetical protein